MSNRDWLLIIVYTYTIGIWSQQVYNSLFFLYLSLVVCRKISTFADKACKTEQENQQILQPFYDLCFTLNDKKL